MRPTPASRACSYTARVPPTSVSSWSDQGRVVRGERSAVDDHVHAADCRAKRLRVNQIGGYDLGVALELAGHPPGGSRTRARTSAPAQAEALRRLPADAASRAVLRTLLAPWTRFQGNRGRRRFGAHDQATSCGGWPDVAADGSFSNGTRSAASRPSTTGRGTSERPARPGRILDIGGTNNFWEQRGWAGRADARIVTVNLAAETRKHENIEPRVGDATDLRDYADGSFDVVFSNSVIEHLRTFDAQRAMAREVHRLAARHWIQTPNYWFPIEPHFLTPVWH